ncbi:MAG TPA: glycosyltransferase family 39 protein [Acidobacteriaceae bacterium]|nr:glycosyltransferase family 39 protein [Acidobacteriaceae bacterium]
MNAPRTRLSDTTLLLFSGLSIALLHIAVNGRYGFHRDELLTYSNARHLAWGYVVYPPLTPFLGRLELLLFGSSLRGFRFLPAVAQGLAMILTGLSARAMGGLRWAQLVAAAAVAISGFSLFNGGFLSYSTFDYLWWVLAGYCITRLLASDDPRWFLAVGAAIGLGLMTRYTIGVLIVGILVGLLLTPYRRCYKSLWFWAGAAVAVFVCLPNFLWQMHHHFIWLQWFRSIHARDIHQGSTDFFLLNQLWKTTNPVTVPFWLGGLWYVFRKPGGKRWRLLGWMYVIPALTLFVVHGRDYYLSPAYPMLFAAGAVQAEHWLATLSPGAAGWVRSTTWQSFVISGLSITALAVPVAPVGTAWWHFADACTGGNFNSQIGWPEMVAQVAHIRDGLPAEDQSRLAIATGDDGETGAIDLYGPAYHLPPAISGMNSSWARGYGDPPPQTLIVIDGDPDFLRQHFESCFVAGRVTNSVGIRTSSIGKPDLYVCRGLREPWQEFWAHLQYYG